MRVLLLNQAFYPDVVSTAQYSTELAVELLKRGHDVTVIAGARGYDNPELRFDERECWQGIRIERVKGLALGKSTRWRRAVDFASFMMACAIRLFGVGKPDVVIALTSPPLISFLAALYSKLRGCRYVFWVMDLNPDEAVAAGWLRQGSIVERILSRLLRFSLTQAERIVVLDRFMCDRLEAKGVAPSRLAVIPPWSHDEVAFDSRGRDSFREHHDLTGKFVVMYAGNHSPCHPLDTLLRAAKRLKDHREIAFCFVGGGSEFPKVAAFAREHGLENIRCIGYQPIEELSRLLSAADLQVVLMGDAFVGLVHPSKIYNILAVARPVLYVGPDTSHVSDILDAAEPCDLRSVQVRHGEDANAAEYILQAVNAASTARFGAPTGMVQAHHMKSLLPKLVSVLESAHSSAEACYRAPELTSLE